MGLFSKENIADIKKDPIIYTLNKLVLLSVKILAMVIVLLIWLSLFDVIVHIVNQFTDDAATAFSLESLLMNLGNAMVVLIAVEIFLGIVFYLAKDTINVPLVLATALTAVARKVIIMDYKTVDSLTMIAIASIILAVGISYWFVKKART